MSMIATAIGVPFSMARFDSAAALSRHASMFISPVLESKRTPARSRAFCQLSKVMVIPDVTMTSTAGHRVYGTVTAADASHPAHMHRLGQRDQASLPFIAVAPCPSQEAHRRC